MFLKLSKNSLTPYINYCHFPIKPRNHHETWFRARIPSSRKKTSYHFQRVNLTTRYSTFCWTWTHCTRLSKLLINNKPIIRLFPNFNCRISRNWSKHICITRMWKNLHYRFRMISLRLVNYLAISIVIYEIATIWQNTVQNGYLLFIHINKS